MSKTKIVVKDLIRNIEINTDTMELKELDSERTDN